MWEEAAGGGILALLFGIVLNGFRGRVAKVEKCKVDGKVCNEKHKYIEEALSKGDERFNALMDNQTKMSNTLSRVDEKLEGIAKQLERMS